MHCQNWVEQKVVASGVCFFRLTTTHSLSLCQTLTEPAIFASETSCDCRAPHEKLTIAQARRGTPGTTACVYVTV